MEDLQSLRVHEKAQHSLRSPSRAKKAKGEGSGGMTVAPFFDAASPGNTGVDRKKHSHKANNVTMKGSTTRLPIGICR